jgi:hypothetical protein
MDERVDVEPVPAELLCPRSLVVEQVMRRTGDESLVLAFSASVAESPAFLVAIGRLLTASPGPLPAGSPLLTWASKMPLDPNWRDRCPVTARSVWGELVFLRSLLAADPAGDDSVECDDPLAELERLREASAFL